ncbi:membrane protein [Clostridium sp. D2Q-11]|uniref:Membrane protein n=1 Tax=Anaeromonas frigoriresistens TaxID=2683708 RepID=A0A942Z877_9FIRM|nr:membrane protein [Anaeromonas frigoriresistens]MBS4539512.1 membrane protein [Anaeromonas frigoriresistens]
MIINKELLIKDMKKFPGLLLAFLFCAYGLAQMKNLEIGMHSWSTLNLGLSTITNLSFGFVSQLIGLTIILFSLFLRIYPGIGTIFNMYFIGLFIDLIDHFNLTLTPENYILKIFVLLFSLIVLSYGIFYYLSFELGAGPRDGLMVGLVKITGINVKYIKPAIEVTVLIIGFLLGGTVGLGTIIVTFFGGYILDIIFKWKNFDPHTTTQRKLSDYLVIKEKINLKN